MLGVSAIAKVVTLKKSVTMDTKIAHIIFLSEALYNPFPFPVIYFILVIFYYYYFFNVFICLFVCPRAGFLAGAALIGLLFPFPLIHSRNIRVRGFDY